MAKMKLIGYQVAEFRSVEDSGWIETDDVTALIGTNESGKTNLLLPLWKLNPASDGEIDLVSDAPRSKYSEIKNQEPKPFFISANFELSQDLVNEIVGISGADAETVQIANVKRRLDPENFIYISFPNQKPHPGAKRAEVEQLLQNALDQVSGLDVASKAEDPFKQSVLNTLQRSLLALDNDNEFASGADVSAILSDLNEVNVTKASPKSTIGPRFEQLRDSLEPIEAKINGPLPGDIKEVRQLVVRNLPKFVTTPTMAILIPKSICRTL